MKKHILLTILLAQCAYVLSQDWLPTGNGTNNGGNVGVTLRAYNGKLIAGGAFTQAGSANANGVAMWDGTDWSVVDSTMNTFNSVKPLVIFRGQLYAFVTPASGPAGYMIRLDSSFKWHIVPNSNYTKQTNSGSVYSACVYNNELFVGGAFDTIGGIPARHIARWDGTDWASVGLGIDNERVNGMVVYNNELYVGGSFEVAGSVSVNALARWNGSTWNDVGGGISGGGYAVFRTMEVYNNELYIGGDFDEAGGQPMIHLTRWNGSTFSIVGGGFGHSGYLYALKVFGNRLIISGYFNNGLFAHRSGTWDGVNFDSLGLGLNIGPSEFEIYDCQLYAGGRFTATGDGVANGVAVLDTIDCSVVNVQEFNLPVVSISIYPNPFSSQALISFAREQKNTTISITDMLGQEIKAINFTGRQLVIEKGKMKAGIYIVQITDKQGNKTNKKVIIQ